LHTWIVIGISKGNKNNYGTTTDPGMLTWLKPLEWSSLLFTYSTATFVSVWAYLM